MADKDFPAQADKDSAPANGAKQRNQSSIGTRLMILLMLFTAILFTWLSVRQKEVLEESALLEAEGRLGQEARYAATVFQSEWQNLRNQVFLWADAYATLNPDEGRLKDLEDSLKLWPNYPSLCGVLALNHDELIWKIQSNPLGTFTGMRPNGQLDRLLETFPNSAAGLLKDENRIFSKPLPVDGRVIILIQSKKPEGWPESSGLIFAMDFENLMKSYFTLRSLSGQFGLQILSGDNVLIHHWNPKLIGRLDIPRAQEEFGTDGNYSDLLLASLRGGSSGTFVFENKSRVGSSASIGLGDQTWGLMLSQPMSEVTEYIKQVFSFTIAALWAMLILMMAEAYYTYSRHGAVKLLVQAQEDLLKKNQELQELHTQMVQQEKMAAVGLLAAGISHEFNNIMTSLYGFAQLAKRNPDYKDKLVEVAIQDGERAKVITESLLSFSRRSEDIRRDTDLAALLDDLVNLVQPELEKCQIELKRDYQEAEPVLVNRGQIQQVFLNLLINATHAIERRGRITLRVWQDDNRQFVEVEDSGKGIAPEHLDKIFEAFFTTKGALGTGSNPGTGLGLTVSRNIIAKHRGLITVRSEVGKGTCFRIEIPMVKDRRRNNLNVDIERRTANLSRKKKFQILAVDDDESVLIVLKEFLPMHKLVTAKNSIEALPLAKSTKFDYIILDIQLPKGMNGFEMFEEFSHSQPDAKIIFLTGVLPDEKMEAYFQKAHALVRKPFDITNLTALLE